LVLPDFGFGFAPGFGPESDNVARADRIALSHDGCEDSPGSLFCCPTRDAPGPDEAAKGAAGGATGGRAPLVAIDIRTPHGNARHAPTGNH